MGFINKLFGIPKVGSQHGEMVDHMLEVVHWIMAILFIGWSLYLTYTLIRYYRKRNPRADYTGVRGHASSHIEIGVIITEIILLLGFAFPLWATQVDKFPDPDVRVNAWAEQFRWSFHYPGPDNKFGISNRFMITSDNPLGIDPEDPNSLDDFVTSDLVLPKGKKIEIAVTSKDVIHNLALVGMRTATDADPGKVNRIWFIPTLGGKSEIICGQLCGAAHGNMKGLLDIKETMASFDEWQKGQSPIRDSPFAAEAAKKFAAAHPEVAPVITPAPTVTPAPAPAPTVTPAPVEAPPSETASLTLGVLPAVMKYDKTELTVRAGQKVKLLFENKADGLMHNFVLIKPGTKEAVGALGDKLGIQPDAMQKAFVPDSPDILAKSTKVVGYAQKDLIEFTAPSVPGDYPYICTYPAHWRTMNGVLKVTP